MAKSDDILKKYGITQVRGSESGSGASKSSATSTTNTSSSKPKTTGTGIGKADSILSKYGITQVRGNTNNFESWQQDSINTMAQISSFYNGQWKSAADSEAFNQSFQQHLYELMASGSRYRSLYADDDEVTSYIDQMVNALGHSGSDAFDVAKSMGQFTSADEYDTAVRQYGYQQKYQGNSYDQIQGILAQMEDGEEKEWLSAYAPSVMTPDDYGKLISQNNPQIEQLEADYEKFAVLATQVDTGSKRAETVAAYNRFVEMYGSPAELKRKIEALKAENWQYQNAINYNFLDDNADYGQQSKVATNEATTGFGIGIGKGWWGVGDPTYDYINDLEGTRQKSITATASNSWAPYTIYDHMKPEEIANYNYLYNTAGKDEADAYLEYLEYTLNQRRMGKTQEIATKFADQAPVFASAVSVPVNLMSGIGALDVAGQNIVKGIKEGVTGEYAGPVDYNRSAMSGSVISSTIRGTVAQNIADATGVIKLDETKHPVLSKILNGKSLGDVYQLGMSMADSASIALMSPVFGSAGTVFLGGSAASQGILDAVANGATDGQAITMGILNGAFEMLFEKVSLENLLKGDAKNIVHAFLQQGFVEGTEELNTTIANTLADIIIMAENSNWQKNIDAYVAQGLSLEEAQKQAFLDAAIQAGWDFVGGMASGGIMGSVSMPIMNAQQRNAEASALYGADPGALVDEALEINPNNSYAQRMQGRLGKGKTLSGGQMNRLVQQNEKALTAQDMTAIQSAAETRLTELGETGDVSAVAAALAKQAAGKRLTRAEQQTIAGSKYGQRVANELNTENIQSGEYSSSWAESIDTQRINVEEYSRLVEAAQLPQQDAETTGVQVVPQKQNIAQAPKAEPVAAVEAPVASVLENRTVSKGESVPENDQQVTGKLTGKESLQVAEDGVTRQESTGKAVMPQKIVSISNGNAVIQTDNGEISAEDIAFGDKDTDMLWRSAIDFHGINPAGANGIIRAYRSGDSVTTYLSGAAQEFRNGYYNLPSGGQYADKLTSAQREIIYDLGQKAAGENTAKAQAFATKAKKVAVSKKETTTSRNGKVHFARKGRTFDAVRETALETMEQLSAVLGVEFHVYESYKNADGKRVYKDSDGNEVSALNGYYDPKDGSIHIDLNAGTGGKGTMLFTIAHELTHFIKQWSPAKFKVLANFLINQYSKQNVSVNELVDAQIAKAEKSGRDLSWDEAFEEMIADSMEAMLTDGNVVQMMADLKQQDKTLWQKICDWFRDLAENLKAVVDAYKGYRPDSQEGRMVADMRDVIAMLESFYADALADASDNYQAAGVQKNTTREGSVKYSIERTKDMSWDEQIKGALYDGKNIRRNDTLIVADPADTAVANVIKDVPLAIPLSILTKASTGKDVSHSIKRGKLANLDEGIKNATMTIVNPERNAVVFVTNITQGGLPVIAAFDMNATFDGDKVHKATSIHLQVDTQAMLQNLPESATVYVQKNELDPVGATNNLRGLAAKIKFIKNVAQHAKNVKKKFSLRDTGEDLDTKEKEIVDSVDERIPITIDMTEAERYEALKDRSISVTAKTNMDALRSIEEKIGQETETAILLRETDRKKLFVKIAEEFDVFKEYSNADVKLTFNFSKGNLKESVGKQRKNYSDFAKMLSCLNEIIETAIGIEVHNRNSDGYKPDPTLKSVYVLVSAFEDGNNIIPVKLEIKEFADKDNTLYVAIALESIKKDEVVKQGNTENGVTQYSRSSIIKIADLFSKINPTDESFLKYVPKQFLTKSNDAVQNQQSADNKTFTAQSDNQFSDRDPELEKVNRMLEKQNEKLKDDVAYLKELLKLQKQVTGGAKFTKTSVEAAAGQLMKYADAKGNKNELAKLLNSLYEYIAKGEELTWEGVKEAAAPAVEWLQWHENTKKQLADYAYDEELIAQDLLRQVYDSYWNISTLYTVADKMQKEINKLKHEHSNRMSTLRKDHREQTAQLKQEHREAVQRVRQAERERGEKKLQDISKRYQESRERGVENRRKTEMRRKIRRTIMELDKLLNRGDKKKNVKEDMKDFVAQALKSADILFTDEYSREDMILNGIGTGLKGQEAKYIAEAREIMEQMGNLPSGSYEAFQQRQEAEARLKGKLAYRMSKLQDVFTRERARLNAAEVSDVLGNLADAYASLEDSEHSYVNGAFHENVYQYLLMLKKDVGGTTVKDMNLNQLEELHKAYTMVLTTVRNANKMFAANMKQTREQLGNQTIAEVRKAGGEKELWLPGEDKINAFFWNNEKPVYAFERIGSSTLARLFENIRAGEDTWAKDMDHARKYYLEQSKKHKYDSWDFNKQYNFTSSSGIDFSLNLEQIMSLYAYSKREQAHDHLMKGGFVFDGNTEVQVSKMGIPVTYLNKSAKAHNVSPEILGEIIGKLTSDQKAFVDKMQNYLSDTMGAKGNEVSIQLYGVELFKEKNYFPLRSAGQYMERAKEADQKKEHGQISIVNSGFTKSTTPKSSNPVVLSGFMNVWADHVNEMSMYHSFVLPMEDFRRVYNYTTPNTENGQSASVNSAIQNAYGEAATKYIDQLYQDLNGGAISDPRESLVKALMGRFKKAAVFASLSVVIQQPSAIGRAFAIIDPKYFVGTKVDNKRHKALWAELKMYAPVASIKEMGYFDTGMGKSAQDFIKGKRYGSLKEKAAALFTDSDYRDELLSKAPALADELTWCAIWDAVKRETKAKNSGMNVKSEEFLQLAGKRFTEVITKTQVYDSVLSRSANMRSKGNFMSMWTAFMAEPTTTINMVEDALRKGKQGDRKYAARTMGAVLCSVILNSALASLVYAMRDDDEDETFLEKYVQSFAVEILDGINPLTYYPFLKDVWSILQGFDIERADMSLITSLTEALTKLVQIYSKDTDGMDEDQLAAHTKNLANAWWGVVDYVTALAGIPVKNVRRDINGAINTVKTIAADLTDRDTSWGSLLDKTWDDVKNSIPVVGWLPDETAADKLYKATVNGDTAYQKRLSSSYSTESALNSAIRKGLRNNDSRIWQAAVAWNNNDLETYKQIAISIVAEGNFSQDNVVMAIRAEAEALAPDEVENTSASNAKSYFTAEKFAVAIAQSNDAMAAVIKEDIIETAIKNGKTADEAEQSFKSSAKSKLKELFLAGEISEEQAVSALTNYLGLEMEDAESDVGEWTFKAEYPELDGIVSYTQFANWQIYGQSSGVALEILTDVAGFRKDGTSGNVKSQEEVAAYIDSLPISSSQKDALWCCFWKESTLNNAPWHQTE